MAYIEFRQINKFYGKQQVLRDVDLFIRKKSFITLLGPSGCGKSTMLRTLAGLEKTDGGEIYLDGANVTQISANRRNIGMVFQKYSLFPNMSVEQNISFGLKMQHLNRAAIEQKVSEMIRIVGLEGREKHYPSQLSGGQQQRVALARALVTTPKVLLLDEPLSAIDAQLRKTLQVEIRRIVKQLGITTIFVTHDQDEAMVISDEIYLMNGGKIEQKGQPVEMYTHPRTLFSAQFMGNYNIVEGAAFNRVVGADYQVPNLAIRPEVVEISNEPIIKHDRPHYTFEAAVKDSLPHGNVLRYTLDCGEVELQSDVLFRSFKLYEPGQRLHVSIDCKNCLELES